MLDVLAGESYTIETLSPPHPLTLILLLEDNC